MNLAKRVIKMGEKAGWKNVTNTKIIILNGGEIPDVRPLVSRSGKKRRHASFESEPFISPTGGLFSWGLKWLKALSTCVTFNVLSSLRTPKSPDYRLPHR